MIRRAVTLVEEKHDELLFVVDSKENKPELEDIQDDDDDNKLEKNVFNEDDDGDDDEGEFGSDDELEKMVFGGEDDLEKKINNFKTYKNRDDDLEPAPKKAKWEDEDDQLKPTRVLQQPGWATKAPENEEDNDSTDDEGAIMCRTGNYITKSKSLPQNQIKFMRCVNINKECSSKGKIRVLEFLSKSQVALVAGADLKLNLFQVDGKTNLKIQTIATEKFPIFSAHFSPDEKEILIGSTYPSLLSYNMKSGIIKKFFFKGNDKIKNTRLFLMSPDGQYIALIGLLGTIHILSTQTKGILHTLKLESEIIEAIAFSPDSSQLFTHGEGGVVTVWSMKTFRCVLKFQDEGCAKGTAIVVSPNGKFLATGSETGIVNVYEMSALNVSSLKTAKHGIPHPKPVKAVENLVSACTSLAFNHTSELLAMASNYTENAVKLLHIQSMTVFANFPAISKSLGVPFSVGFSPNSGYFSVGNHKGNAHLFRLRHYTSY